MTEECPKCWARLSTPLFCDTCHELVDGEHRHSPFHTLGVETGFHVDRGALRRSLLALSRRMHPDFHGHDPDARRIAEANTAELNAAFEVLDDDLRRADWLVASLGGPSESDERQMPPEFLMEVMEWNETVEAAREGADPAKLDPLERELRERHDSLVSRVGAMLDPLPEAGAPVLTDARRLLNAVRYVDKTLREIAELRLDGARNRS